MGPLVIEFADECIKAYLLLEKATFGWASCLLLQCQMHTLMPAVLLWMARFDALNPHKAAIRVMMRELPGDPLALACFLHRGLRQGLDWMLAAAELDAGGFSGAVRRKLLGGIYLDTMRVWLRDDGTDMAATMAHLDKRLEQALGLLTGRGPISKLREKSTASA